MMKHQLQSVLSNLKADNEGTMCETGHPEAESSPRFRNSPAGRSFGPKGNQRHGGESNSIIATQELV